MASLINKARKPKFELHLTIYDLNNVPLGSGSSYVKWYLPHSIHAEHRGRTAKCAMDKPSHRVTYNYSKIVPIRISIDKSNNLTDCPIEFEVLQEVPSAPGGRDERLTLGLIRLNLSEYVEESENFPRRAAAAAAAAASRLGAGFENARDKAQNIIAGQGLTHRRLSSKSSSGAGSSGLSPTSANFPVQQPQSQPQPQQHPEENDVVDEEAEEGIVRRYLMQDSKINSTLKIGILMVQVDGERNYVAPPLKTAPMFSGITGIMAGGDGTATSEPVDDARGGGGSGAPRSSGASTSLSKSRDVSEVQDMYRRTLAASWLCQPGELPADECIEDIFSGGNGWRRSNDDSGLTSSRRLGRGGAALQTSSPHRLDGTADDESVNSNSNSHSNSNSSAASPDEAAARGTLRPTDVPRIKRHGRRQSASSNHSDRSTRSGITVIGSESSRDRSRVPPSPPPYTHSSALQQQHMLSSHFFNNLPLRNNNHQQHLRPPSSRGREDNSTSFSSLQHQHNIITHNDSSHEDDNMHRSGSMASLVPTLGGSSSSRSSSDRGRRFDGFRRQKEVDEHEVREDLIAWKLPGTITFT